MSRDTPVESAGHVVGESAGHVFLLGETTTTFYMLSDSNNLNTAASRMLMANYPGSEGMLRGYVVGTGAGFSDVTIFFLRSTLYTVFPYVGLTKVTPDGGFLSVYDALRTDFPVEFPDGGAWIMFDTEHDDPSNPLSWNYLSIKSDSNPLRATGQYTVPSGGPNLNNLRPVYNWHRVLGTPADLDPTRTPELKVDDAVVAVYNSHGGTWDGKLVLTGSGGPTWESPSGVGATVALDTGDSPLNWRLYGSGGESGYLNYRLSAISGEQQYLPFGTYDHFGSFTGVYPDTATISIWPP